MLAVTLTHILMLIVSLMIATYLVNLIVFKWK